ncbi:hypothetical protein RFI_21190, partial [Reticulomyxa filosa]
MLYKKLIFCLVKGAIQNIEEQVPKIQEISGHIQLYIYTYIMLGMYLLFTQPWTKQTKVLRLIATNENLRAHVNELERQNASTKKISEESWMDKKGSRSHIIEGTSNIAGGAINSEMYNSLMTMPSQTGLGTKLNPIHTRTHMSFREFLLSLIPFLLMFWLLGGFDLMRGRKVKENFFFFFFFLKKGQGGTGGSFGKNFSEWDETDWEDDEEDSEEGGNSDNKNGEAHGTKVLNSKKNRLASGKDKKETEDSDLRSQFFRRLGIDVNQKNVANQYNHNALLKEENKSQNNKDNTNVNDKDKDKDKDKDNSDANSNNNNANEIDVVEKEEEVPHKKKHKRVRFRDVCGNDEAKMDLQDLVDYLKNPEKYQQMGCKLPKGVLLAGPPGTGKTLMARALAGEAGVPFFATNGASFDEVFVGVGVVRVKRLFERAKEKSPCIVFIDEIDAIGNTRMQMGTAHSSDSLNALLSEMDGFEQNAGIIVIAATNMPDRLDHALVRPGRFDRKVYIQLPDAKARKEIASLYLKNRQTDDVDLDLLVSDIAGFSGAELESMVNLASIEAVKQGKNK